jgi:hypothetical protein
MARPQKQGVDYFPLDVHMDNKIKFIKIKFGMEGLGVIVAMLQNIYSQGYFIHWSDDECLLLADEFSIDPDRLQDIIKYALEKEFFSREKYDEFSILTSKGVQKRYKEITKRRKDLEIIEDYLLINWVNASNNGVNVCNNPINVDAVLTSCKHDVDKSTQRKVKERKVKETKEEKKGKETYLDFVKLTPIEYQKLIDQLGLDLTNQYIEKLNDYVGSKGKRYKSHYHTIRSWHRTDGSKSDDQKQRKKNSFHNFSPSGAEISEEELEKLLIKNNSCVPGG